MIIRSVPPVYGEGRPLSEAVVKVNARRIDLMSGVNEVIDDEVAVDASVKLEARATPSFGV